MKESSPEEWKKTLKEIKKPGRKKIVGGKKYTTEQNRGVQDSKVQLVLTEPDLIQTFILPLSGSRTRYYPDSRSLVSVTPGRIQKFDNIITWIGLLYIYKNKIWCELVLYSNVMKNI